MILTIIAGLAAILAISLMTHSGNIAETEDDEDYLWGIYPEDTHYIDYEI